MREGANGGGDALTEATGRVGKFDGSYAFDAQRGAMMFPNAGEVSPAMVASVLMQVLREKLPGCALADPAAGTQVIAGAPGAVRVPGF